MRRLLVCLLFVTSALSDSDTCRWTPCRPGFACHSDEVEMDWKWCWFWKRYYCCEIQDEPDPDVTTSTTTPPPPVTTSSFDPANWMRDLILDGFGNKPFHRMLVLGTHNSGYHEAVECGEGFIGNIAKEYAQCQQLNLEGQLDYGSRSFDIRIECDEEGKLEFFHGVCSGGRPEEEFFAMRNWLDQHPSEVVILVVRGNFDTDFGACQTQTDELLSLFSDLAWTGDSTSWPTLEEMVMSNQRAVMIKHQSALTQLDFVRDRANLFANSWAETQTDDPDDLVANVLAYIDQQTPASLNVDRIWAVSFYATPDGLGPNPQQLAQSVNPRLPEVMNALTTARDRGVYFDALRIDYAGSFTDGYDVVRAISEYNKLLPDAR